MFICCVTPCKSHNLGLSWQRAHIPWKYYQNKHKPHMNLVPPLPVSWGSSCLQSTLRKKSEHCHCSWDQAVTACWVAQTHHIFDRLWILHQFKNSDAGFTNCTFSLIASTVTSYHLNEALYSQHTQEFKIYIEIHRQIKYHHSPCQIQSDGQSTQMGFLSIFEALIVHYELVLKASAMS